MSYREDMQMRIDAASAGSAFVISDFTDLMDYETAKKNLDRFEKAGKIRRVMRGVYDKPRYSEILKDYAPANTENIANAIARNYHWDIAPTGEAALNYLGISTQVPGSWDYVSSGPYKSYDIGNVKICFLHRSDRMVGGMSPKTALVIQALKSIGRERVDERTIRQIRNRLSEEEKANLLVEGRRTIPWIYSIIKEIAKTEEENVQRCRISSSALTGL